MAGKIGHIKIFRYEFTFVFRYRYEKGNESELLDKMTMWREWRIGLFYRRFQIVGRKKFNEPKEWKNNCVYEYMLGIDLLIYKAWFTVNKGGMTLNIDNEKTK